VPTRCSSGATEASCARRIQNIHVKNTENRRAGKDCADIPFISTADDGYATIRASRTIEHVQSLTVSQRCIAKLPDGWDADKAVLSGRMLERLCSSRPKRKGELTTTSNDVDRIIFNKLRCVNCKHCKPKSKNVESTNGGHADVHVGVDTLDTRG